MTVCVFIVTVRLRTNFPRPDERTVKPIVSSIRGSVWSRDQVFRPSIVGFFDRSRPMPECDLTGGAHHVYETAVIEIFHPDPAVFEDEWFLTHRYIPHSDGSIQVAEVEKGNRGILATGKEE